MLAKTRSIEFSTCYCLNKANVNLLLHKNSIKGIVSGSIKNLGRSRISVDFSTTNLFKISSYPRIIMRHLSKSIRSRGRALSDMVEDMEHPHNCDKVIKVRLL